MSSDNMTEGPWAPDLVQTGCQEGNVGHAGLGCGIVHRNQESMQEDISAKGSTRYLQRIQQLESRTPHV